MTRVACCQLHPRLGELEHNAELTERAIHEAVADGAEVVVLPELATSGYAFTSPQEAAAAAVDRDHEILGRWRAAAGDAVVVGGFCEVGDAERPYNSAAVIDASGVRAVYRKAHLWDREKLVFAAGDALPPVVATAHGRIAPAVCYDLEFPELTRAVALAGTELLCVPTNWPLVPRPEGERPPEVQIAIAAARVNRMAVACCDRIGNERGQEWTQGTTIVDPLGVVLAASHEETTVAADVDLAPAREKALTPLADALGDRRPELYGPLVDGA